MSQLRIIVRAAEMPRSREANAITALHILSIILSMVSIGLLVIFAVNSACIVDCIEKKKVCTYNVITFNTNIAHNLFFLAPEPPAFWPVSKYGLHYGENFCLELRDSKNILNDTCIPQSAMVDGLRDLHDDGLIWQKLYGEIYQCIRRSSFADLFKYHGKFCSAFFKSFDTEKQVCIPTHAFRSGISLIVDTEVGEWTVLYNKLFDCLNHLTYYNIAEAWVQEPRWG